jgi:hypothetical protein
VRGRGVMYVASSPGSRASRDWVSLIPPVDLGSMMVSDVDLVVADVTAHVLEALHYLRILEESHSVFSLSGSFEVAVRGMCLTLVALDECSGDALEFQPNG